MGAAVRGKSSGRRGSRRNARMSEINVTPFVDVMLVLLIVFMVAAPLLTVGVPVKLPKTAANPLPTEQREPVTINVDTEGRIYLQGDEVIAEELAGRLAAIASERGADERVFLRGDGDVGYGRVMEVMGQLNAGGFSNIGLVTDPGGQAAPDRSIEQ